MNEIERKFLVKRDGAFKKMASSQSAIAQGYMNVEGATVRIRLRDEKAYLTIKGPSRNGGLSRYEFEREIPVEDAREMLKLCKGGLVEKTRYLVPYEGHTFEVDEFKGANEGLLFAEVELKSEDEPFEKPEWLGPEVTGDRHFYNKGLLKNPYSLWKQLVPAEYRE
jgi:CYTH domain-containing protein